jgi:hypothetical protein
VTPSELLTEARTLIARPDVTTAWVWPRTAALLARQALEQAVDARWAAMPATLGMRQANMHSQLISLPCYLDPDLARQIAYTWAALSNACHYRPYELAPNSAELISWIDDVATLVYKIES